MTRYADQILDEYLRPIAGAKVYISTDEGELVSLTDDFDVPLPNPLTTGEDGTFYFNGEDGNRRIEVWLNGKIKWRELIRVGQPDKGDPGGNVASIGTFAEAPTFTIPAGTDLVQLSGTATDGDTGAGRVFAQAAEVDASFVAANPLIAFRDLGNRGFREVNPATGKKLTPFLVLCAGQSGALGANAGGLNPASPMVKVWDPVTGAWGSSDYTQNPLARAAPDGNAACNNEGLALCHRVVDDKRRPSFLVLDAKSGTAIDQWVGSGTASTRYAALKTKVEAALATAQMTSHGKTTLDCIIWDQGPEDYLTDFATYQTKLTTLVNQFRAETWCDDNTPIYFVQATPLHDRYMPKYVQEDFASKVDNFCQFIPSNGLVVAGNQHFDGPSVWQMGYERIGGAHLNWRPRAARAILPFWGRGTPGEIRPNEATAIATFDNLCNWGSRIGGGGLNETFNGDGVTTAFTLSFKGTPSLVRVGGVDKTAGVDYTVAGQTVTFTVAPPAGASNVQIFPSVLVDCAAAVGSIQWGNKCFADGNYSYVFGDRCEADNGTNYTLVVGQLNIATNADWGIAAGANHNLTANYASAFGRGHNVSNQYGAAFGVYSVDSSTYYLRVGNGTSNAVRKDVFGVTPAGDALALGSIGYMTGAGGAVTQATSKSTGVTLNKPTGQITMNGAALAAATSVSFTFTNNTIEATDVPVVSIASAATAGAYMVTVDAVASGSCRISVRNVSAGSLSEALVLNFALIKAKAA